jgi:hypothetical protein
LLVYLIVPLFAKIGRNIEIHFVPTIKFKRIILMLVAILGTDSPYLLANHHGNRRRETQETPS